MSSQRPTAIGVSRTLSPAQRFELAVLDQGTLVEALVALAAARLCVHFCFRSVAPWTLKPRPSDAGIPHPHLESRVSRSLVRAARLLPGQSLCLPQAMAAKWMLERRGHPATIHLGAGTSGGTRLHAHAWLEAGGAIITGANEIATVTPIRREHQP